MRQQQALCIFMLLPQGFRNAQLRGFIAQLLGIPLTQYSTGRMTYDLRRLRLHGIITRQGGTHCYHLTHEGLRVCLFMTKVHQRVIRHGFSQLMGGCPKAPVRPIATAMKQFDIAVNQLISQAKLSK
uniref:Uncharacterized protein n=1 Tax=Candidatus Kentrum sp. SD TaxID=2126332 RepID=A0A450YJ97_9GAMM|nr:MAG: hypothetical protein BECKSD772F_GA0070984_10964 [Candidatus Kentron sp. SD]VFK47532.1 MAG: hypothetical protein BECKSD772E_GA0070983_10974 [Candidatus Kentron sp. SD]VFK80233.1 MAG: hypothetical protein BECKSD772D_GA0070982_10954 [Candidatus Kentron sp. SD]